MERLTSRRKFWVSNYTWEHNRVNGKFDIWDEDLLKKQIDRLVVYEDTGLMPEEINELIQKFGEWIKAEQEGRLIILPVRKEESR